MDENEIMEEEIPVLHFLHLDEDGYLLSIYEKTEGDGPHLDSLDGYDFSGDRLSAYRWDGEKLVFDNAKYVAAQTDAEIREKLKQAAVLALELKKTDADILEAFESLLSATTITGFMSALMNAGRTLKDTISSRADLREQIARLREEAGE